MRGILSVSLLRGAVADDLLGSSSFTALRV
jgi:hypothetical protein